MPKKEGVKKIKAQFIPTQKNKPAENFLSNYGFQKEGKYWIFSLQNPIKITFLIENFEKK